MKTSILFSTLIATVALNGCAIYDTLTCPTENWVSHGDILDNWLGKDINDFERRYGVQPTSNMPRPKDEIRYVYRVHSSYTGDTYNYCDDTLTVSNTTGKIVGWSYEGSYCAFNSYCATK